MKLYFVRDENYEQCTIFVKKRDAKNWSKSEGLPEPEEKDYSVTKRGILKAMKDASDFTGNSLEVIE